MREPIVEPVGVEMAAISLEKPVMVVVAEFLLFMVKPLSRNGSFHSSFPKCSLPDLVKG